MSIESEMKEIEDMPKGGPLAVYREKASFNWKKMKLFFENLDLIKYKKHIWDTLRQDTLFVRPTEEPDCLTRKEIAYKRVKRLNEYAFLTKEEIFENPVKRILFDEAIIAWDIDASIKYSLHFQMFEELLRYLGTERHVPILKKCYNLEIFGCFALTEMKHGSNTKEMKTTAHYDPKTQEFIINTPTLEDSKVWVGNMGKTATHSAVYAQLYTPDGVCHGLHIFIVPLRDPHTMLSLPGVVVGDMGPKLGLNGIDNGFVTFHHVRVPRENLLNRTADVSVDGKYVTPIKDANKRFGISLGALSNGRVGLTHYAPCFQARALTIAVRYAAVRKQFGPQPDNEIPIIEYQMHQYRLMPYLAACYAWRNFSTTFFHNLGEFLFGLMTKDTSERQSELGKEIHYISCASKPVSSWTTQAVIQECREACGGNGYLHSSSFGEMRNSNDPLLTFEGDNNVLIQQTSNCLLSAYDDFLKTRVVPDTPLKTLRFLHSYESSMTAHFRCKSRNELLNKKTIMEMFDWLLCYALRATYGKLMNLYKQGKDAFTARNETQVYLCKTMSFIFMERLIIERLMEKLATNQDTTLEPALDRIFYLSALHFLDKHVPIFYQGGYFQQSEGRLDDMASVTLLRTTLLELCAEMKDDAVALVDAIAPPDFVLNSPLGNASGNVYMDLYNSMIQTQGAFERITFLDDYIVKTDFASRKTKSKL